MKTSYPDIPEYVTKDGSTVRELMHPGLHENRNQSLAEAIVAPRMRTTLHRHRAAEELYHIVAGAGRMMLGDQTFEVRSGDTVAIPPGTAHCVENIGAEPLRILCCCAPAYSHADTELLEGPEASPRQRRLLRRAKG